MSDGIGTCADSLLEPGICCWPYCRNRAGYAVLIDSVTGLAEHTRCLDHLGVNVAVKPLQWDPLWGPVS